jgi:hypothetical protein
MRRHYRWIALGATLLAATAFAQQAAPASRGNPLSRGSSELFGPSFRNSLGAGPLDAGNAIARPSSMPTQPAVPVTPVPEPSEWLMMAAGLGMVGWILRRRARRS